MKFRRRRIRQKFKGRVQRLRRPDDGNGENDPAPIRRCHSEEEPGDEHKQSRFRMNPGIVLAAHHPRDPGDRVAETADAACEFEWSLFGFWAHYHASIAWLGLCGF